MFTTPRKQKSLDTKEYSNSPRHKSLININATTPMPTPSQSTIVLENGTIFGNISSNNITTTTMTTTDSAKLSGTTTNPITTIDTQASATETVISINCSSNSLNQSECEMSRVNEESAIESTALLEATTTHTAMTAGHECNDEPAVLQDEFDQFILNRTTSESNILESSIYSELHFSPSQHDGSIVGINSNNGCTGDGGGYVSGSGSTVGTQMTGHQTTPNARQTKRTKRKHKTKSKCTATAATLAAASQRGSPTNYPPRYTAIFMDGHHHANQCGSIITTNQHHSGGGAANALGQIASAAASSPFLNAPVATDTAAAYMQQFQYFQHRPLITTMAPMTGHRRHHRSLFDGSTTSAGSIENSLNLPAATTSSGGSLIANGGGITPPIRLSFRKWFSRPSLPFVIGILALGGVACTLGGIVLGSTGLIEHSTQYLSAALLMIGIGVSLLVISGAIWRLSLPDDIDECPCYRHMEMCRSCNSPYCNTRLIGGNYLYPEFQHRPPPPSYLTSLNECAGMGFMFHPTATAQQTAYSALRLNTPPPLYRSTNSLSIYNSASSANQHNAIAATAAATTTIVPNLTNNTVSMAPNHSVIAMSTVMENLQAQTQPLIKDFNYLDLD